MLCLNGSWVSPDQPGQVPLSWRHFGSSSIKAIQLFELIIMKSSVVWVGFNLWSCFSDLHWASGNFPSYSVLVKPIRPACCAQRSSRLCLIMITKRNSRRPGQIHSSPEKVENTEMYVTSARNLPTVILSQIMRCESHHACRSYDNMTADRKQQQQRSYCIHVSYDYGSSRFTCKWQTVYSADWRMHCRTHGSNPEPERRIRAESDSTRVYSTL